VLFGSGIGHLCAAAIACATNIVNLPNVAVEAVRLAFRIGSVVETYSVQGQRSTNASDSWRFNVCGSFQKIQEELQTVQDSAVSFPAIHDSGETLNYSESTYNRSSVYSYGRHCNMYDQR
jgi:hypothetical protein